MPFSKRVGDILPEFTPNWGFLHVPVKSFDPGSRADSRLGFTTSKCIPVDRMHAAGLAADSLALIGVLPTGWATQGHLAVASGLERHKWETAKGPDRFVCPYSNLQNRRAFGSGMAVPWLPLNNVERPL